MRKLKRIRKYPAGAREKAVGQRQKVGGKDQQGYGGGGTWRMRGSAGAGVFRRDAAADSAFTCPLQ